jgi:hypothetical protein
LKGRHFSSDAEVIAAAETWLDGQPSELFLSGFQKLVAVVCFFSGRAKDLSATRYVSQRNIINFYIIIIIIVVVVTLLTTRPLTKHVHEEELKSNK